MMLSFDFHLLSFVVLTGVLWVLYKLLLEGRVPVRVVYAYLLVGMVSKHAFAGTSDATGRNRGCRGGHGGGGTALPDRESDY